ncbi:KAP family P-loop NTPase fold protein [Salipiger abyssi]|uniref:KAP family P-loop NTPase fold protein n=1 Tax=Salipiger abyssi TaxID=1250539 RepID=UPI004058064F
MKLYEEGFGDEDLLFRKPISKSLSDLVERISDPLVIALDGRWGSGKSYFLSRWVGSHCLENEGRAMTVYFDAYSHDYVSDPLPALVSALSERFPTSESSKLDRVKRAAFKLAKPAARIGLAAGTAGAMEVLNGIGDALAGAVSGEAAQAIDQFWKREQGRREAILDFREALEALSAEATEAAEGASLVFVVDELDRCRPDYALEVLEVIKHFFNVDGVHFVLGVNLAALENSVCARYGAEIDAEAYLRKFINVTLRLPSEVPNRHERRSAGMIYLNHLMEQMETPRHFKEPLSEQLAMIARDNHVSIRDVGKIVSSVALLKTEILDEKKSWSSGYLEVLVTLLCLKVLRPSQYENFENGCPADDDVRTFFGATDLRISEYIGDNLNPDYDHRTFWIYMLWKYISSNGEQPREQERFRRALSESFGSFGRVRSPKKIPKEMAEGFLDMFRFAAN